MDSWFQWRTGPLPTAFPLKRCAEQGTEESRYQAQDPKGHAQHDGNVRKVENAGPDGSPPHLEEIHHGAAPYRPIQEVAQTSAAEEGEPHDGQDRKPRTDEEHGRNKQPQEQSGPDGDGGSTPLFRKKSFEAENPSLVLMIVQLQGPTRQ